MDNSDKNVLFICACHSPEHQLIFSYDEDDTNDCCVYVTVHLCKEENVFVRIWNAIKYIFGHTSKYGDFDEFIFNPSDSTKLEDVVEYLKKCENDNRDKND